MPFLLNVGALNPSLWCHELLVLCAYYVPILCKTMGTIGGTFSQVGEQFGLRQV